MQNPTELNELTLELARIQERFATLEVAAESCCNGAVRASKLAEGLDLATINNPDLRKRAEGLSQSAQQLKRVEQSLRSQIQELRKPLQSLESFGLKSQKD